MSNPHSSKDLSDKGHRDIKKTSESLENTDRDASKSKQQQFETKVQQRQSELRHHINKVEENTDDINTTTAALKNRTEELAAKQDEILKRIMELTNERNNQTDKVIKIDNLEQNLTDSPIDSHRRKHRRTEDNRNSKGGAALVRRSQGASSIRTRSRQGKTLIDEMIAGGNSATNEGGFSPTSRNNSRRNKQRGHMRNRTSTNRDSTENFSQRSGGGNKYQQQVEYQVEERLRAINHNLRQIEDENGSANNNNTRQSRRLANAGSQMLAQGVGANASSFAGGRRRSNQR